jgi:hypothetical protein
MLSAKQGKFSMSKRRKLTTDEKAKIKKALLKLEREKHPGAHVTITLQDEIDDNGQTHYTTMAMTETVMPPGWKPK